MCDVRSFSLKGPVATLCARPYLPKTIRAFVEFWLRPVCTFMILQTQMSFVESWFYHGCTCVRLKTIIATVNFWLRPVCTCAIFQAIIAFWLNSFAADPSKGQAHLANWL